MEQIPLSTSLKAIETKIKFTLRINYSRQLVKKRNVTNMREKSTSQFVLNPLHEAAFL